MLIRFLISLGGYNCIKTNDTPQEIPQVKKSFHFLKFYCKNPSEDHNTELNLRRIHV